MFKNIKVKNFQSLRNVELELSPFTVIVGATDSGKSAFFRAVSTLISNRRGSDFITHGEKLCSIEADMVQGHVKLQRGKATNDNFYEVTPEGGEVVKFSKLGGAVPEEVSAFLKIPAKDPINVASQFDKPYLLDTKEYGPSETARILGALTNVNLLFEGARESNRQKTSASSTLRIRMEDLTSTEERLQGYEGVESSVTHVDSAEEHLEQAQHIQSAIDSVERLIGEYERAQEVIDNNSHYASIEIPDISEIERVDQLIDLVERQVNIIIKSDNDVQRANDTVKEVSDQIDQLERKYEDILRKAGTCPTCGQTTH